MIKTRVFGKIVKQYKVPINEIKDFNNRYEEVKKDLDSFGPRLAGRLDSELQFTKILESTEAYSTLVKCIDDYITDSVKFDTLDQGGPLEILSCWINDMKPGEYNPPHTHHNLSGYSTVLFLKIPEFINDAKDPHKFKDGQLGFVGVDGVGTTWIEPEIGDFFIFHANHQHCVMPFKSVNNEIRRSMSFNFTFKL
tara:strand:+ start:1242 stop:1826 length:585 start_codon:yes stop_codon:yes gene_type:complete